MRRYLRKAEEENKVEGKGNNRDQWKHITKLAVHRNDQWISLTPTKGKLEEEQEKFFA